MAGMTRMSSQGALRAASLSQNLGFNWIFLVELIVCGVLTLFFLFYFNRLFASLISWAIRTWTWHKYRIYIDIQAIQISLLGGRIFFKGLRYHGNNQTILVHSGYVTWTYWLRNTRELKLKRDSTSQNPSRQSTRDSKNGLGEKVDTGDTAAAENAGQPKEKPLPCRLSVNIKGLEWFIYNRSAAYDTIVAALAQDGEPNVVGIPSFDDGDKFVDAGGGLKKRAIGNQANLAKTENIDVPSDSASSSDNETTQSDAQENFEENFFLQLLPVHLECTKAAIVLGNENTRSIFVTKADKFTGEIDATVCRAPDLYKQIYNFDLVHPVIQLKPNDDFVEDQSAAATRAKDEETRETPAKSRPSQHRFHRFRRHTWHKLQNLVPYFSSSVETFSSASSSRRPSIAEFRPDHDRQWQGLSRYLDDDEAGGNAKWSSFEYATVTTILDSPEATVSYHWDEPGKVPEPYLLPRAGNTHSNDINGSRPPGWGIDVAVKGAFVNYGPWADRQRAELQKVFFPGLCKDAVPAKKLKSGDTRVATSLKIYIQLDDDTVLRVPIREESKNWKWKAQADTMTARLNEQNKRNEKGRKNKSKSNQAGPEIRPFGWLDIKMSSNATINYTMDMVASQSGFSNNLKLDLPALEVTTSVNHGLLARSLGQQFSCDLSNPLGWNALHTWKFDFTSQGVELFILREHIFLLIDLVDDWTTGPPPDYLTFVPFRYLLNLQFGNFKLYLNVNDANIINSPSDLDDNTFLVIFGTELTAGLCLPIDNYRPHRNAVSFDVNAHTGGLYLNVPSWNTQSTFLHNKELAQLQGLGIKGKYEYCDTTSIANTDTAVIDVSAQTLECQIYGFFIRYLLKVKDNYFGEDMHFKTLEEYQQIANSDDIAAATLALKPPFKRSNDLDVFFTINVAQTGALLPANLYSADRHVRIDIASISADLRFTNYYMDLNVTLSPMSFSLGRLGVDPNDPDASSATQLYIDGLEVYGNRLFGLPPTEPTYICNWDFGVGEITGEATMDFLCELASSVQAIGFSFDDDENALPALIPLVEHDVTFLRAAIERVHVWVHVEDSAFLASTSKISIKFDNWARQVYSAKLRLLVPELIVSCVDAESASRHRSRPDQPVETHAYISTHIDLTMFSRSADFQKDRELQQAHIRREDSRTHRTPYLLHENKFAIPEKDEPPAMWIPPAPQPLLLDSSRKQKYQSSIVSSQNSSIRRSLRHKQSFLSVSSSSRSSQKSIIRTQSSLSVPQRHPSQAMSSSPSQSRQFSHRALLASHTRDQSVGSTGRQSSFYSALGYEDRRPQQSSTVGFSSPYLEPYFPLDNVDPSVDCVPIIEAQDFEQQEVPETDMDDMKTVFEENVAYTSFIVEFKQGVRAYCSPDALRAVSQLVEFMQPTDPNDILDSLQEESMGEIFDTIKERVATGKKMDVSVRLPAVRLRFRSSSAHDFDYADRDVPVDQYDLAILGLSVLARRGLPAHQNEKHDNPASSSAVHVTLGSIELSAKERIHDLDNPQAAVTAKISTIALWLASDKANGTSGGLYVNSIDAELASADIEYLASLIHRTAVLAKENGDVFSTLSNIQKERIRVFALALCERGAQTSDPPFLTKPSYTLRQARDHLRTMDSWKAITRLRHIYNSLPEEQQQDIRLHLSNDYLACPADVRERVLVSFELWRSWDLDDLPTCVLMRKLFGPLRVEGPAVPVSEEAVRISVNIKHTSFVLDRGPKQNEVSVDQLNISIGDNVRSPYTTLNPADPALVPSTLVQVYADDVSVNLNWELCELAENVLKLYTKSLENMPPTPATHVSASSTQPVKDTERHIHLIMATESGSVTLDTINLHAFSLSKGLKASVVLVEGLPDNKSMTAVLVTAEAATTKVRSHQDEVSVYQIRQPTLNVSLESQKTKEATENTWKIAGNSQQISFTVKQEPLVLLDVLERVIGDEVMQIKQITKLLPQKVDEPPTQPLTKPTPVKNRINVALFLDVYDICIPLLHSLRYDISGRIARASVVAGKDGEMVFDFDIKENKHDIEVQSSGKPRKIPVFEFPPTNGRVTAQMDETENKVSAFVSVEQISVDAAALQGLITALNGPEIASVLEEVKESTKSIQHRIEDVFGSQNAPTKEAVPKEKAATPFIYDAHVSLAGLEVYANAPNGNSKGRGKARLTFNLGYVQIEAKNRTDSVGPALKYPELYVRLRRVVFDIASDASTDEPTSCGNFAFQADFTAASKTNDNGELMRSYHLNSSHFDFNLYDETASTVVNVVGHLQKKIKELDLTREVQYFQRLRHPRIKIDTPESSTARSDAPSTSVPEVLFESMFSLDFSNIRISWIVASPALEDYEGKENLVFSLQRINLSTRKKNSARLTIENLMLQMVPPNQMRRVRSHNSALLPEIIFNVGVVTTKETTRLAFMAKGKSLDLQLTSQFVVPGFHIQKSIESSIQKVRTASESWMSEPTVQTKPSDTTKNFFLGKKRWESLLVDANFAGANVRLQGMKTSDGPMASTSDRRTRVPQTGRFGQFTQDDTTSSTELKSPGLAIKVEYIDNGIDDPSMNAEVKVEKSSNTLYPLVVPLILEMTANIKTAMGEDDKADANALEKTVSHTEKIMAAADDNILTADPSTVLGKTRLNLGLRICAQEFTLSCTPFARVSAKAQFDDIYMTMNTVRSADHGHFFALSAKMDNLRASVQHVYSRESTGDFQIKEMILSLMNSKHLKGVSGLSAILKISPMRMVINAKQLQDFLLFRDIWIPADVRHSTTTVPTPEEPTQSQAYLVQRYQEVAATAAFPWNATVSIDELDVQIELGQAIGKTKFLISKFWVSTKKNSDWEQNLCLGFEKVHISSVGRLSGFASLEDFKVRTSIQWPEREKAQNQTPLVQGAVSLKQFHSRVAFDYQVFLIADILSFNFMLYNIRNGYSAKGDRLVSMLEGESVQVFCTTTTAALVLGLYQAIEKLVIEKKKNYEASLQEVEKFMKRKVSVSNATTNTQVMNAAIAVAENEELAKAPITLHTDLIVTLHRVDMGVFPMTFYDNQVLKLEAKDADFRFAVVLEGGRVHSRLGTTLGQLRVGLAGVTQPLKNGADITVGAVVLAAVTARGGTILKVPRVDATMETWQQTGSKHIDYIFKSSFEGKVEVGWNYSRISYIRGMYAQHARTFAQRAGKPLPPSAVKITGVPDADGIVKDGGPGGRITAEVTVPASKYQYEALEPPIIEAPQLRDMGEATPPLEWIGLHRDRLPHLTHQIVIVTLLELASEVEDAYAKILGST